jgi:hypothetical protein
MLGDHLVVSNHLYTHHGLDLGQGRVVHYAGSDGNSGKGPVRITSRAEFAAGRPVQVISHPDRRYGPVESARRGLSRVDEAGYSMFHNNCEHFVRWCITGRSVSRQVDRAMVPATAVPAAGAGAGGVALVGSCGTVAGLSGPGIISGLAAIGPGGAVGGAATLAGSAGLGAALLLNNTLLRDHGALPESERSARRVGRAASYAGAGVTAAGGVAAIGASAAAGTAGGAAIMSGLATIGAAAGATAAPAVAGVAVVVAGPVLGAVALGLGVYKLAQWCFD